MMSGKKNSSKNLKKSTFLELLWKDRKYIIWGMPFYNEQLRKVEFENEFNKLIND